MILVMQQIDQVCLMLNAFSSSWCNSPMATIFEQVYFEIMQLPVFHSDICIYTCNSTLVAATDMPSVGSSERVHIISYYESDVHTFTTTCAGTSLLLKTNKLFMENNFIASPMCWPRFNSYDLFFLWCYLIVDKPTTTQAVSYVS